MVLDGVVLRACRGLWCGMSSQRMSSQKALGSMGELGALLATEGTDALPRMRVCSPKSAQRKKMDEASSGGGESSSWGVGHYHALGTLWCAYFMGMCGKGAMTLAIFGASKDEVLEMDAGDVSNVLALSLIHI